ncbi:hypothetical protein PILCRDRAFT_828135 [Piloderma croceum F 1598]|uniref:ZZ-type domain-containing protein n=1 Tax=Piloderma croceum (strain F 1598) TaxID=765440 RepID=A0A0C3F3L6_PILCF|nr:hypothetical protein PILCRDRAFT_828135 [Piloderma croceum F 1598]
MQQKLLENMSQVIAGNSRGAGGYASLLRTSDNSRINAISALGEQYQRLAIEAPIAAPPCEHMAYCDVCNSGIHTVRYKCTKCPNYDMCSECFGSRRGRHNTHHQFRSIGSVPACGEQYENLGEEYDLGYQYEDPAPRREPVAYCDVCGSGIDGMRYKCTNCSDYDMCPACFRSNRVVHNTYHQFCSI